MNADNEKLSISIELAKAGFENAQGRIALIDTKVSIAVGLIIVLLPAPLVALNWVTGLQGDISKVVFGACAKDSFLSLLVVAGFLGGMLCAFVAMLRGISCLSPRGPKGYGKIIPFQKEWQPNVLFPIFKPENEKFFFQHLQKLQAGIDLSFVVKEYDHQMQQLGSILHVKFTLMTKCFCWLYLCLACYGAATICGALIGVKIILK